jgi:hypothetical protein
VFVLCFLDTQSETTFSLKIPLIRFQSTEQSDDESSVDIQEDEQCTRTEPTNEAQTSDQFCDESATDTIEVEEIGSCETVMESTNTDINVNDAPQEMRTSLELTDEDIEEMLTALRSVPDVPPPPNEPTANIEMDEDLREVLELDINHFIV